MKLYRTGSIANGGTKHFKCYADQESSVCMAGYRWNDEWMNARVHFNSVGKGWERHSDYAIVISYKDILNALVHINDPKAKTLVEAAYAYGDLEPRYPVPSKISHWCNVLMTEVRKGGLI